MLRIYFLFTWILLDCWGGTFRPIMVTSLPLSLFLAWRVTLPSLCDIILRSVYVYLDLRLGFRFIIIFILIWAYIHRSVKIILKFIGVWFEGLLPSSAKTFQGLTSEYVGRNLRSIYMFVLYLREEFGRCTRLWWAGVLGLGGSTKWPKVLILCRKWWKVSTYR